MTCTEILALLPDHLKGTALPETAKRHLASCSTCHQEFEDLERLWEGLGNLPQPDPGSALRSRVLAPRPRRWKFGWSPQRRSFCWWAAWAWACSSANLIQPPLIFQPGWFPPAPREPLVWSTALPLRSGSRGWP